ncbi:MAG: 1,4-alpha-glucan branching protein GlgB [Chlamydiae bacterium]|nr:1,4-alpha-glucan branching protein GlgB [Chlamydiota bacterium]
MINLSSSSQVLASFLQAQHNPHSFLGLHQTYEGGRLIRLWRPGASEIYIELKGSITSVPKVHQAGLFALEVPLDVSPMDYKVYHNNGLLSYDPYVFSPIFGEMDAHLFSKGVHYELYDVLGARFHIQNSCSGVKFAVWAPSAVRVSVIGDFNHWDGKISPMRSMGGCGVWELFVPGLTVGEKYKFEISTLSGSVQIKSDPMAYATEFRPKTASIVADLDFYEWKDENWTERETSSGVNIPMTIYEVHLASWKKGEGEFLTYKQLAHDLAAYCKEMGFTHIEIMPLAEHPLDESWGYQVTGPFAITSRYGSPSDFQYFVDYMHQHGIGVIIDWVAAHFPLDEFSLSQFDGTALYEHADPKMGFHPHWNTCIFNYGRREVSNYLIASALFWFDKMHIDGLRVDAVASMLYLDYGREHGQWIPNKEGGKENLEAIEFLKHLNSIVHTRFPKALMFAEESTSYPGVTHSLLSGGLGFDIKWNMGWMNDTLKYFAVNPFFRYYHQNSLTFSLLYAFSERFALVLSHDEVVHGKSSLLAKMPGDEWQKFANVRLLYSYMICHPGKKLLFMGGEIGQWTEWNCKDELSWYLLAYPRHLGLQRMVRQLNLFYQKHPALWELDFEAKGFEWIDFTDRHNSVISYLRKGANEIIACVHNFTPAFYLDYFIRLPNVSSVVEIFNTDREEYGGSGKLNPNVIVHSQEGRSLGFTITLAPLATMIFKVKFP